MQTTMQNTLNMRIQQSASAESSVQRLIDLARVGLVPMFDRRKQLFCHRLKKTSTGLVQEGISHRYTMMCLMGLHRLEQSGVTSPIEIEPVLDGLLKNTNWIDNVGDLGILLWACSIVNPDKIDRIGAQLDVASAFSKYPQTQYRPTMELAWFLTGLSYCAWARPEKLAGLKDLAFRTFATLKKNQGQYGYFANRASAGSFIGRLRGRIGNFADQVYPIYGMAKFWEVFGEPAARDSALHCAQAICEAQGPLGQWWWHYDSVTGQVVDGYPVFSVHQHAMAPLALFGLGDVTQSDFTPSIFHGLRWINSQNELNFEAEDASARLIWRCIFNSSLLSQKKLKAVFGFRNYGRPQESPENLSVRFECRPYELGWLLYAFAGRNVSGLN